MNELKKRAFIKASGFVLGTHLPENYQDWVNQDLDEWMEENAAGDYCGWHCDALWEIIEDISDMMISFHEEMNNDA